ncbi:MAG: SpoIVB peptidase [Ruminococcaceae bacterium]|nr:SpoIVB peptidase [Oscillospiraceae bacterium]
MRRGLKPGKRIKIFAAFLAMLSAALILECQLYFPETITLFEGERLHVRSSSPYYLEMPASGGGVLTEEGILEHDTYNHFVRLNETGTYETTVKLFGVIPVRTVAVQVEPKMRLAACGNTVGIKIFTKGLVCVGTQALNTSEGHMVDLSREHDVRIGDILLKANDIELSSTEQLGELLAQSDGAPIHFVIRREGRELTKTISPVKTNEGYKLGLWIRDSTAGIGTLTYYDPASGSFGALGHPITDSDTGALMPVSEGSLLKAAVVDVKKGKPGDPGELKGIFKTSEAPLGMVMQNTEQGVFGVLDAPDETVKTYPVASRNQVNEGPATIISNIHEEETAAYKIEIQKVARYQSSGLKDLVIRVTDSRLLEETGGIVQGMSGSPILQNGRIVGAVTHVFVNDPTRGYGIFIENMLAEAEKIK